MAKIKLGDRPQPFRHTVKAQLPDGSDAVFGVTYRYRTRTEYWKFQQDYQVELTTPQQAVEGSPAPTLEELARKSNEVRARFLLEAATGWELDYELNLATATQLCDELPGVAGAILDQYGEACNLGRLGN